MRREATTAERDGYWYRMVVEKLPFFRYSWGTADMEYVYRAQLEYRGRGKYVLRNRTFNGEKYKPDQKITRRQGKRHRGYQITISLIERLLG